MRSSLFFVSKIILFPFLWVGSFPYINAKAYAEVTATLQPNCRGNKYSLFIFLRDLRIDIKPKRCRSCFIRFLGPFLPSSALCFDLPLCFFCTSCVPLSTMLPYRSPSLNKSFYAKFMMTTQLISTETSDVHSMLWCVTLIMNDYQRSYANPLCPCSLMHSCRIELNFHI